MAGEAYLLNSTGSRYPRKPSTPFSDRQYQELIWVIISHCIWLLFTIERKNSSSPKGMMWMCVCQSQVRCEWLPSLPNRNPELSYWEDWRIPEENSHRKKAGKWWQVGPGSPWLTATKRWAGKSLMPRDVWGFLSEMSLIWLGEQTSRTPETSRGTKLGHTSLQKATLFCAGLRAATVWEQPCWSLLPVKTESGKLSSSD